VPYIPSVHRVPSTCRYRFCGRGSVCGCRLARPWEAGAQGGVLEATVKKQTSLIKRYHLQSIERKGIIPIPGVPETTNNPTLNFMESRAACSASLYSDHTMIFVLDRPMVMGRDLGTSITEKVPEGGFSGRSSSATGSLPLSTDSCFSRNVRPFPQNSFLKPSQAASPLDPRLSASEGRFSIALFWMSMHSLSISKDVVGEDEVGWASIASFWMLICSSSLSSDMMGEDEGRSRHVTETSLFIGERRPTQLACFCLRLDPQARVRAAAG